MIPSDVWSGVIGPIVGALAGGLVAWLIEHRKTLREERLRKDAEKELADEIEAQRGPRYVLENRVATKVYCRSEDGTISIVSSSMGRLLGVQRQQVSRELADGVVIALLVTNIGEPAMEASAKLDLEAITLSKEVETESAIGLEYFSYPFVRSKLGTIQNIELRFRSTSGREHVHHYETIHGVRSLKWINSSQAK